MRRLVQLLAFLSLLPLLAGATCQHREPVPEAEVIEKPVRQFRAIDPKLTAPCGPKATGPLSEVIRVARERGEALDECADRMDRIRALQPKVED